MFALLAFVFWNANTSVKECKSVVGFLFGHVKMLRQSQFPIQRNFQALNLFFPAQQVQSQKSKKIRYVYRGGRKDDYPFRDYPYFLSVQM